MERICYIAIITFLFIATMKGNVSEVPDNKKAHKILIIHSYTEKLDAYAQFGSLVQKSLTKKNIKTAIRTFYLDCERYNLHDEEERMYKFIESIQNWKPDLILVNDDQATFTLMTCNHPFVKTIPVIFSAVNFPNWELLKEYPNVKGFWDKPDYINNIRLIEMLYGKSRVLFFKDMRFIGREAYNSIQNQMKSYGIPITEGPFNPHSLYANDEFSQNIKETELYVAETANLSARQLLWIFEDKPYTACLQIILDFNTLTTGRLANVPNFTVINNAFNNNKGITGGYFTTLEIQSEEVSKMASRVLQGEKITGIPVTESKKTYAFDWKEIDRFNINQSDLPVGSIIYNMPFTVRYHTIILISSIAFFFFMLYIIVHLTFMYRREAKRKKQIQINLVKEKEFLKLALEGGNTYAWRLEHSEFIFEDDFFTANHIASRKMSFSDLLSIIHPDDKNNFYFHIREVYSGSKDKATVQCRFKFNGNEYTWWELRYNHGGNQTITGICLNIQTFKNREEQLTILQERAEEANKMKTAFLANMSHEIRTPLNAIVGFSNLLQEDSDLTSEEKTLFKETINNNSNLLLKLINDILELSRIESGRMSFTFENCLLKELLGDIYQTHRLLIPPHIKFLKDTPELPVLVHVDKHRFIQVITNFINNAVKFTPAGHILIGYHCNKAENFVYIFVEDTGKGLSEEAQKKVFERFYKQDEFAQGTGLGLPICKMIAERMDGDILVDSEIDKGSRFTLKIPYTLKNS